MDINLYRSRCLQLREKFGEHRYSKEELNEAWKVWKDLPDSAFEEVFSKIMAFGHPLKLDIKIVDDDREDPHEAIGFRKPKSLNQQLVTQSGESWEELTAKCGVKSLVELLDDKAKRERFLSGT